MGKGIRMTRDRFIVGFNGANEPHIVDTQNGKLAPFLTSSIAQEQCDYLNSELISTDDLLWW